MTAAEYFNFYAVNYQRQLRLSEQQAIEAINQLIQNSADIAESTKQSWQAHKDTIQLIGTLTPSLVLDMKVLTLLAREMHRSGSLFTQYQIKNYGGKLHVILKGYPGLRLHLTGTRYLANHPKVISMGIGLSGVKSALKGGGIFSVVFSIAFHSLDQLLDDTATWHNFVAGVSTDILAALAGVAATYAATAAFVAFTGTAMLAIGPMIIVVAAGAVTAIALFRLFNHWELAKQVAVLLKQAEARFNERQYEFKSHARRLLNYAEEDPQGFMARLFGLPYIKLDL